MKKITQKIKDFIVAVIVSVKQELESSDKAKRCCGYKVESTQATKGAVKKSAKPKTSVKINSSNKCAKTSTKSSKKSKKERDINALLDSIAKDRAKQGKRI